MDQSVPNWFNEEFLKLAISEGQDKLNEINLKSYNIESAAESGNCSLLYRVKVEYNRPDEKTTKSSSFFIKTPLTEEGILQNLIKESKLANNEFNIYNNVLPKMYDIHKQEFSPKHFFCQQEGFVVLEDLKEKGYETCNPLDQMDYPHCKHLIMTLAKFHATTVALHSKNPELVESNGNEPIYNVRIQKLGLVTPHQNIQLKAVANIIEKHEGLESLAAAIRSHSDSMMDTLINAFNHRSKLNVLNHGDCWTNNILFKHEEGKITDCKLIDFQIRRFGSPAIDLLYFLLTSPNDEVREKHINDLIELYRKTLNDTLSGLGCTESLSSEELEKDLWEMYPWSLISVAVYLPLILSDPKSPQDPEEMLGMENLDFIKYPFLKPLLNQSYSKKLPSVCKQLISFGILKYLTD